MHEVIFDEEAIGFLDALPKKLRSRLFNKIILAKTAPFHFFQRLSGRSDFKMRVGDYRVIAEISGSRIEVTLIGHRKDIYGRKA